MKKSIKFISGLIIFSLLLINLISFASAKISISEPLEVYNLGDKLYVSVNANPGSVYGNFEINLNCGEVRNIYRVPAEPSFSAGEEQSISTYVTLDKTFSNFTGTCNLVAFLGSEVATSKNFKISDDVNVELDFNKTSYDPAETITLHVQAIKENGNPLNGFMEVSGAVDFSKAIVDGIGKEQFAMPDTIEAGNYELSVFVYDRGKDNQILNSANKSISFSINQVPSFVQTSLSALEVGPGEDFSVGAEIFDQSGKAMDGSVSITLISPNGNEEVFSVDSGGIIEKSFALNATPGTWRLYADYQGLVEEKEVDVLAVGKAEFDFLDSILIVKSVGNAVYNKTIDVQIGENTKELVLNIQPGEERRFNLKAPDGEYEVLVSDGEENVEKNLLLTGNAVSVSDLKGVGILSKYPIVWLFIIVLLAGAAVFVFFKFRKKEFKLKDKLKGINIFKKKEKRMIDSTESNGQGSAEQTLVLKGDKEEASIISLKVQGLKELGKEAKLKLKEILKIAKTKKAMINVKGDYIMIIFSPLVTKTFKNPISASVIGEAIVKELQAYNKKSVQKIDYGIGIHNGMLINSIEDGKLKYTSVGNSVIMAKKLSDISKGELLVSEAIKTKLIRDLKVSKVGKIGEKDYYKVNKVSDREANQDRLRDILDRMKREEGRS